MHLISNDFATSASTPWPINYVHSPAEGKGRHTVAIRKIKASVKSHRGVC